MPAKAVAGIAECLEVKPEDFSFDAGLKPIILGFLTAMPELPQVILDALAEIPPNPNLPKVAVEFIVGSLDIDLPPVSLTIDIPPAPKFDIKLGNPNFKVPELPGGVPAFDVQVLIDFIIGLINIVAGLPDLLPVPTLDGMIDLVGTALGLPGEPSITADFKAKFGKCVALSIMAVLGFPQ